MMKYLLRWLRGQCTFCGQKLDPKQTVIERMTEINKRADVLTASLGRPPLVQNCQKCQRIVFEGEPGFVQSLLLFDMELGRCPKKQVAIYHY